MMNYQSTPRSNRPRVFSAKYMLQFALFAAFSLWLLYQIRQPNGDGESSRNLLSHERISNSLGRKGSGGGLSKPTPIGHLGLTLEDVTNPGEEGEIPRYSKGIEEVEFHIKTGSLNEGNDSNSTLQHGQTKTNEDETLTVSKSNISFPDENGIPQHVRDKFVGTDSSNKTRVEIENVRAAGNRSNSRIRDY